jgi:C4-dicarboxylate-specific signal transduction histidine kinase
MERILEVTLRLSAERAIEELKTTGSLQPFEKEYFRKDGSRVPVLIGSVTFDGRRDQGVGFVLDLTERKRAEAEARESERRVADLRAEMARVNRIALLGQLTASIAHEVNQPIASTRNNASAALNFLDTRPPELDEAREALRCIVNDADRAGSIVGRIRDQVRKVPPHKDDFDINDALKEVIASVRGEVTNNGVSVQTRFGFDLPPIQADRVQLQQVILNLILNAVEAMSSGDEARELLISTEQSQADAVLVSVGDTGPGVDPGNFERIFDSFFTTKSMGMGLGLSICRSIIEAHGGRLWASANVPRGAVFQFTLPSVENVR